MRHRSCCSPTPTTPATANVRDFMPRALSAFLLVSLLILQQGLCLLADDLLPAEQDISSVIDHYIDAEMKSAGISAAPTADDNTVLRRTMLDLVGRVPTAQQAQQYAEENSESKRGELVARLMAEPAALRHTTGELLTLLGMSNNGDMKPYLLTAMSEEKGWDAIFQEMISPDPATAAKTGAPSFLFNRVKDLDNLTNTTSVVFFGVNISCAKCHDHPLVSEWTQAHFYGMKSFFNRTFENGDFLGEREYGAIQYKTTSGETLDAPLMFLNGSSSDEPEWAEPDDAAKKAEKANLEQLKKDKKPVPPPEFSRRSQLVKLALEDDQNYLARAIINRTWHRLIGYGLVMPLDQMHPANPPSHPALMDWLTRDFVAHGYNLNRLVRGIVLSRTYARSSRWESDDKRPAQMWFAVGNVRPLTPSQYATSLRVASRSADHWKTDNEEELAKRVESEENAARGLAGRFQQPDEDFQVSVREALLFNNNVDIQNQLLADNPSMLVGQLKQVEDAQQLVTVACWSVLGRTPDETELKAMTEYLAAREDRRIPAIQQLIWALLTSGEFRFNY